MQLAEMAAQLGRPLARGSAPLQRLEHVEEVQGELTLRFADEARGTPGKDPRLGHGATQASGGAHRGKQLQGGGVLHEQGHQPPGGAGSAPGPASAGSPMCTTLALRRASQLAQQAACPGVVLRHARWGKSAAQGWRRWIVTRGANPANPHTTVLSGLVHGLLYTGRPHFGPPRSYAGRKT